MLDIPWTNARFIYYPDAYATARFVHIATPDFVKRPDSLFQCNGDTLCGSGESRDKTNGVGYYRTGAARGFDCTPQVFDTPPPGMRVCSQCLEHLKCEYLPFVEEE